MWDYYRQMFSRPPEPAGPARSRAVGIEELHPYKTAAHKARVMADLASAHVRGDERDPLALAGIGSRIPSPDLPQPASARTPFQGMDTLSSLQRTMPQRDFEELLAESMARQRAGATLTRRGWK